MKTIVKNILATILLVAISSCTESEKEKGNDCDEKILETAQILIEKSNAFTKNGTVSDCNAFKTAWLNNYNQMKECGRSTAELDAVKKNEFDNIDCSVFGGGTGGGGTGGGGTGGGGTGGGSTNGNVMFWTKNSTIGAITVNFNGQSKQINQYQISGSPSSCGVSGFANYNLTAGSYSYTASSVSGVQWSGSVNVPTNGGCFLQELAYSGSGGGGGGGGTGGSSTGHLTVWSSNTTVGTITVTCGGQTKYITSKYTSAPNCEANGCAVFDLPFGTYSITATASNGTSWNPYSMNISTTGQCYMLRLQ